MPLHSYRLFSEFVSAVLTPKKHQPRITRIEQTENAISYTASFPALRIVAETGSKYFVETGEKDGYSGILTRQIALPGVQTRPHALSEGLAAQKLQSCQSQSLRQPCSPLLPGSGVWPQPVWEWAVCITETSQARLARSFRAFLNALCREHDRYMMSPRSVLSLACHLEAQEESENCSYLHAHATTIRLGV